MADHHHNDDDNKDDHKNTSSSSSFTHDAPSDEFGLFAEIYQLLFEQQGRHDRGPWPVLLETVDELFSQKTCCRVLDVACGPGEPATSLAVRYPSFAVTATDLSPAMVRLTRERMERQGVSHARAHVANAQDLADFDSDSLDLVTCFFGFIFCPDPPQALREAARVLKPGGRVICTVWERMIVSELRDAMVAQVAQLAPEHVEEEEDDEEEEENPVALGRLGLMEDWMEQEAHLTVTSQKVEQFPLQLDVTTTTQDDLPKTAPARALQALSIMLSEEMKKWGPELAKRAFDQLLETSELLVVRRERDEITSIETVPNRYRMIVATKKAVDDDNES